MKKWIAFFSHTGSEIVNISNKLGRTPDKIITNKPRGSEDIHEGIQDNYYLPSKPTVDDYRSTLEDNAIITMHGWMRIIPSEICADYNIFNLHPGLISRYPELKGKDPQHAAFSSKTHKYDDVGCVIHKATPELDSGEIIMERSTSNTFYNFDELNSYLHKMAEEMWVHLLPEFLK